MISRASTFFTNTPLRRFSSKSEEYIPCRRFINVNKISWNIKEEVFIHDRGLELCIYESRKKENYKQIQASCTPLLLDESYHFPDEKIDRVSKSALAEIQALQDSIADMQSDIVSIEMRKREHQKAMERIIKNDLFESSHKKK